MFGLICGFIKGVRVRYKGALILAVFGVLAVLFFYRLALTNHIMARGDVYTFFYPYWDARSEALRTGELPLWTPDLFMGVPLLAEPQMGVFYPPNWLVTGFDAPEAVKISLLLHAVIAGAGVFLLFNATLRQPNTLNIPAIVAGALFSMGGYLSAHAEQINQYQGMAWLGWAFWLWYGALFARHFWGRVRWAVGLALVLAMVFFSGHTQTLFIIGVGLGLFTLAFAFLDVTTWRVRITRMAWGLLGLAGVSVGALVLAIPQLLPTLELIGVSNRGGSGFNAPQATAFSLPPHYIGWSLLPQYDSLLFTEYIATVGIIGLGLALLGIITHTQTRWRWVWLFVAFMGVFMAFGRYNPFYYQVLAEIRGFDFFRVPARWLALFALGVAMLGGLGVLELRRLSWRSWGLPLVVVAGLVAFAVFVPRFAPSLLPLPEDVIGANSPANATLLGWGAGFIGLVTLWRFPRRSLAMGLVVFELLAASQVMPFNDIAPRDVYEGQRFTISQLKAYAETENPMGRVLPISTLLFDLGDRDVLRAYFEAQGMSEEAVQYAFTALKRQETLFANLPLKWHLPSVDGYGGGLLPHIYYTQWSALFMPEGELRSVDGRIGEALSQPACWGACLPDATLLQMMDVRYLLTDKIYDVWHDNVAYDTAFLQSTLTDWRTNHSIDNISEVRVLHSGGAPTVDSTTLLDEEILANGLTMSRYAPDTTLRLLRTRPTNETVVYGVSLVGASGVFTQTTPIEWERVLSSDIKLYRKTTASQRAFIAEEVVLFPDTWQGSEDALLALQDNPAQTIIHSDNAPLMGSGGEVTFATYEPTRMMLNVRANAPAYVVIRDSYYEGWQARVNGESAPVYRADVLFRAVPVPMGESTLELSFAPALWQTGFIIGVLVWGVALVGCVWVWRKGR